MSEHYFNLGQTIQEAFQIIVSQANNKNIELKAQLDDKANLDLIIEVFGDKKRLLKILNNFLTESLKFTNQNDKITIEVKVVETQVCLNLFERELIQRSQDNILSQLPKINGNEEKL